MEGLAFLDEDHDMEVLFFPRGLSLTCCVETKGAEDLAGRRRLCGESGGRRRGGRLAGVFAGFDGGFEVGFR